MSRLGELWQEYAAASSRSRADARPMRTAAEVRAAIEAEARAEGGYGAEDAGADWFRIPTPNRIVIRALDSGDERLAPLAKAVAEHDAEYARLASIPAEPEQADEGLDVERLREAARNVGMPHDVTVADIENLATEYARLVPARDEGLTFRPRFAHVGPHAADYDGGPLLSEACPACRELLGNARLVVRAFPDLAPPLFPARAEQGHAEDHGDECDVCREQIERGRAMSESACEAVGLPRVSNVLTTESEARIREIERRTRTAADNVTLDAEQSQETER